MEPTKHSLNDMSSNKPLDEERGRHDTNVQDGEAVQPSPKFSIFTTREKKFLVIMASLAALLSPISASIYYPALGVLASDLDVTNAQINLTVTAFLIFQGLAPTFIGNLSDERGRRPSYLICFVLFIAANIGLALQNNYAALFVLRCLQSSGSSGTVALASAVVADVVTSAERGTYMGYAIMGALVGPAFGPVIGGLLCQYLSWRSVFWFLAILAGVIFSIYLLLMPETCRKVVGNGSIPPQRWNISLLAYIKLRAQRKAGGIDTEGQTLSHNGRPNLFKSIKILFDKESGLVLLYSGLLFTGFYMIVTSLPSLLEQNYGYNTLQTGLCFLPTGFGAMSAVVVMGRSLDWNFRRLAKKHGLEIDKQKQQDTTNFPIEHARLQVVLPTVALASISVIAYGWVIESRTSIAGPIVLLFLASFFICGAFHALNTLLVDLNRTSPGGATATMNLARCWMGAGGVAAVIPLQERIGVGWTGVLVAGIWALISPFIFLVIKSGPEWRERKRLKQEERKREEANPNTAGSENMLTQKD